MDFNSKNSGKRKAQSIQDMINTPQGGGNGLRRSSYSGPKSLGGISSNTMDLSGINVNRSDVHDRWGNSNDGMPKPKKQRYKADVGNPMRGNVLKRELEQSSERLGRRAQDIDRERRMRQNDGRSHAQRGYNGNGARPSNRGQYVAPVARGPLDEFGWIIFSALLFFCVIVTLIVSGVKPRSSGFKYPMNIITISGVVNTAYEHTMGINGTFANFSSSSSPTGVAENVSDTDVIAPDGSMKEVEKIDESSLNDLGEEANAAVLDDGTMTIPGVTPATSHSELVQQIKNELANGNYSFVSTKLAYADEATGELDAYPMSVVKHFCEYMAANPDKLSSFASAVDSEEYSAMNGSAYILKLPVMKFTIKMGESTPSFPLDNTVVSVSGFTDVIVNGNQNAAIYPLLPCIYNVTLTNNAWPTPSQSQEVEATLGEGDLAIKVGKSSE